MYKCDPILLAPLSKQNNFEFYFEIMNMMQFFKECRVKYRHQSPQCSKISKMIHLIIKASNSAAVPK
ncbi:hypothetical protein T01_2079 [Trichinella spiralis]|uniref:Uncharacterized protein n=1 Tax=Trichinella spiralis TaxID=6334 RepID=A0A0V1BD67_TRISP|nr:hypothetical protein T01_2079 [Trichinella spiralis]